MVVQKKGKRHDAASGDDADADAAAAAVVAAAAMRATNAWECWRASMVEESKRERESVCVCVGGCVGKWARVCF